MNKTQQQKKRRMSRIRSEIRGTKQRPRLSVFRSNEYVYGQIIDDTAGKTLIHMTEKVLEKSKTTKTQKAKEVGIALAKAAIAKKITTVVFDKGAYKYHGRVKALAEGAREGGLTF